MLILLLALSSIGGDEGEIFAHKEKNVFKSPYMVYGLFFSTVGFLW